VDDLTAPLGRDIAGKRRFALSIGIPHLLVGVLSLGASIERIVRWAKAAEGHGIALVPITAVVAKPKSSGT